jgi:hypothetical protein
LVLRGEQGTGKSTALGMLAGLVDPSAAPAFGEPSDTEHWVTMAHGGWCVALDNIEGIPPWFSVNLCRAVTGQGVVRRRLYTDGDFAVLAFRRVMALTTINLGPVTEDLAARMLPVDLELIDKAARVPESQLFARYEALKPKIFGALLDEVAATLRNLPHVHLEQLPRMADFARILAALPSETPNTKHKTLFKHKTQNTLSDTNNQEPGTPNSPLAIYLQLIDRLAVEVIEGDPVAVALGDLMETRQTWQGTATELLSILRRPEDSRGWPKTAQPLTARLKRLAPSLRTMGITIDFTRTSGFMRTRLINLKAMQIE